MNAITCRALVVDDETLARTVIKEHLEAFPFIEVVGECANGFDAVKQVGELKPDLLFLDIQMPKLDGFEVLELLPALPAVIFVTAYDQYAVKAFESHAVDYLLKPFGQERFSDAVQKALQHLQARLPLPVPPQTLVQSAKAHLPLDRIIIKDGHKITIIPLEKVDYLQAQDDYVLVKTREKGFLKEQTLTSLEQRLDPQRFLRIHRSYIIQLDRLFRLEQTESESWVAVLVDGSTLPVSRSGYTKLKPLLSD